MVRNRGHGGRKRETTWAGLIAVAPIVVSYVVLGAAVLLARSLLDAVARADLGRWWPGQPGD